MFILCLFTKVIKKSLFIVRFSKFKVLQIAKKQGYQIPIVIYIHIYHDILKVDIDIRIV